jgi:hypothetical protein
MDERRCHAMVISPQCRPPALWRPVAMTVIAALGGRAFAALVDHEAHIVELRRHNRSMWLAGRLRRNCRLERVFKSG